MNKEQLHEEKKKLQGQADNLKAQLWHVMGAIQCIDQILKFKGKKVSAPTVPTP